ncbi:MAG: hypothetical protein GY947_09050 [Rhodobacteraceae bacterium]|nr:hypothetical protein [Paracoccaceae bacterium]
MRYVMLASFCLMSACSEVPVQKAAVGGKFIDAGPAKFAVFSEGEEAIAVYLGALRAPDEGWVLPAAREAIERVTGCPVMPDTLRTDSKTIQARVDCSRATAIFIRGNGAERGRSARSGQAPTRSELARIRLEDDAEE